MPELDFSDIGEETPQAETASLSFDDIPPEQSGNAVDFSDIVTEEPPAQQKLGAAPMDMLRRLPAGIAESTADASAGVLKAVEDAGSYLPFVGPGNEADRPQFESLQRTEEALKARFAQEHSEIPWYRLDKASELTKKHTEILEPIQKTLRELRRKPESALATAASFMRDVSARSKGDFGVDPRRDEAFLSQVASGAGSVVPAIATGPLAPVTVAGMMGESGRKEAEEAGASKEQQDTAFYSNAAVGVLSEALMGVPALLRSVKAAKIPERAFAAMAKAAAFEAFKGSLREGSQEFIEQVAQNTIAKYIAEYDPQRSVFEGALTAGAAGAIIGGPVSATFSAAENLDKTRPTPASAPAPAAPVTPVTPEATPVPPAAAATGPATAAAVSSSPEVAAALNALSPSRDYAAEAAAKLAATQAGTPPAPIIPAEELQNVPKGTPEELQAAADAGQEIPAGPGAPTEEAPAAGAEVTSPAEPTQQQDTRNVEGVTVERVSSAQIAAKPDLMQFKRMDDSVSGTAEEAKLEGTWDDLKAGTLLLWEPKNPSEHGLTEGQQYIVANGHYRFEFGQSQNVTGYNAQVIREEDGYSAADARRLAAEINIADNKGTIYDQAKFLRESKAALGPDEALEERRRIGARGRKASSIAFNAADNLFDSFINERVTPDHAEQIANAAPNNEAAQRLGIQAATQGKSPQMAANIVKAGLVESGGEAETMDLFGTDDSAIRQMEQMAERASSAQSAIREQISAVQGAARRPEVAAKLGVNVQDPAGVQTKIGELREDLARWNNWPMHPDLVTKARGVETKPAETTTEKAQVAKDAQPDGRGVMPSDLFAGGQDDPFNLVSETTAERMAREAQELAEAQRKEAAAIAAAKIEADKQQQKLFASPESLPNPWERGRLIERNGRMYRITTDRGTHVDATALDNPAVTITVPKPQPVLEENARALVSDAAASLAQYLKNVGHEARVFDGYHKGTTMYVGIDGSGEPRIYVNWKEISQAITGMTKAEAEQRIYDSLTEEIVHVAEVRYQSANPETTQKFIDWVTNPNSPDYDPQFHDFLRKTYTGYDSLAPFQKAAEAARVIVQKRWLGRVTEAAVRYLKGLRDWLNSFVSTVEDTPEYIQEYIKGIEDILYGRIAPEGRPDARLGDEGIRGSSLQRVPGPSIVSTGIRTPEGIATGGAWNMKHADIIRSSEIVKMALAEGMTIEEIDANKGFIVMDENGNQRFAGRKEALEIARKSGQVDEGMLYSVDQGLISEALVDRTTRAAANQRVDDLLGRIMQGDDAALEELDAMKQERFGPPPTGTPGSARGAKFFSAAEFEKFFMAQYAARDFDAILEAVKASDVAIYGPLLKKLFRAQATDPAAAAQAEWMRAIFNGTRPADAPPPKGAKPPPAPTPATPPGPQQAGFPGAGFTPPPMPPPPPMPKGRHPFNIPGLVWLSRKMGSVPRINSRLRAQTRGRFKAGLLELNEQLFKDPAQAAKTLAHEIGHFFDYIPMALDHAQLAEKVAPLKNWKQIFGSLWDWSGQKISVIQKVVKDEAVTLSKAWRGDFAKDNDYRNSADELYADFLSALMVDPDWCFTVAPYLSGAFFAGLEQKPAVKDAFNLVNEMLRSDILLKVIRDERTVAEQKAVSDMVDLSIERTHKANMLRKAWNSIYGGFINKFGPTMAKAGGYWAAMKRRLSNFGEDFVSEMETIETFARSHIYTMHDRLKAGTYRLLEERGIPVEALSTYLLNRRIIHERTQTGLYLQSDPDEARELFGWMASEAGIESKWQDIIDDTPDSELYDLGARIIRDLYEQDLFDVVFNASQRVDAPDFAERGLFAFDVSGFMLNPNGIDPENAEKQNKQIEAELGPDGFKTLQQATKNYYDVMKGITLEANRLGLFRPKTWTERIEPNLNNYVPMMVIDYFTGHVEAGMKQRKGTAKEVLPVHLAGQLKSAALLRRMQRQKQALLLQNFYRVDGAAFGFDKEMTIHSGRMTEAQRKEIRANGHGLMGFFDQGEWKWMQFKDGSSVAALEKYNPDDLAAVMAIGRSQSNFWRLIMTTYSVSFTLWNALRTVKQAFHSHGRANLVNMAKVAPLAKQYAEAVVNGAPLSPELREMIEIGALPAPDQSLAGQGSSGLLAKQILAGMIGAEHMVSRTPHEMTNPISQFLRIPFGKVLDGIAYISGFIESAPKIATQKTLTERGETPKVAAAYARMEGIPNPGVSGKYNTAIEVVLMFARVHIQGLRAFRTRVGSPKTRGGYVMRSMLSQLMWKAFYVAAAKGAIDALLSGGDDKDKQVDWEEFVKRSTPYKLEMDDLIFLGWIKPDGGYAVPFGHKEIPATWTPMTVRIPHSEDGRYINPISSVALTTAFNSDIRPVDPIQRTVQIAQSFLPGSNPGFDVVSAAWQIDNDTPPQDSYKGQPIVAPDEWEAGYDSRILGLSKYFMSEVGVPGFQNKLTNENLTPFWTFMRNTPALNRLMPLDNYQGVRELRRRQIDEKKVSATARNMRGTETIAAMHRMNALESKGPPDSGKVGARNSREEDSYRRLREWYNEYYQGTTDSPGLMETLRAKAAGVPNVDADYAKKRLDETAKEALQEARTLEND